MTTYLKDVYAHLKLALTDRKIPYTFAENRGNGDLRITDPKNFRRNQVCFSDGMGRLKLSASRVGDPLCGFLNLYPDQPPGWKDPNHIRMLSRFEDRGSISYRTRAPADVVQDVLQVLERCGLPWVYGRGFGNGKACDSCRHQLYCLQITDMNRLPGDKS